MEREVKLKLSVLLYLEILSNHQYCLRKICSIELSVNNIESNLPWLTNTEASAFFSIDIFLSLADAEKSIDFFSLEWELLALTSIFSKQSDHSLLQWHNKWWQALLSARSFNFLLRDMATLTVTRVPENYCTA